MPWQVKKGKNGNYVVVKKDSGEVVVGDKTKLSKNEAENVMKAMYANVPEDEHEVRTKLAKKLKG